MESNIVEYFTSGKIFSRKNSDLFGVPMDELHWGKLFVNLFGEYYSKYSVNIEIDNKAFVERIIQQYSLGQFQIIRNDETDFNKPFQIDHSNSNILLIIKKGLALRIYDKNIEIYYSVYIQENERNEILELVTKFKITREKPSKFYMVKFSIGQFELAEFEVKPFQINIDTHYNSNFEPIHSTIFNALSSKNRNGLILLHGKFGTGKTYYIRYLISSIDKKFIYFPLSYVDALSSPEFLPFISDNPNSVLILEDCESLLVPRENGISNSPALSNLLNLGDGLLSDALSLNVICTFNANIKKIDDALLRKGRLLARYEFKELEVSKGQALANRIGKNIIVDKPMTVSDIYNYDDKCFENTPVKIGFNVA